jgi:hypothetical protein
MKRIALMVMAAALFAPLSASGQEAEAEVVEESAETTATEAEEKLPFGGSLTLSNSIGTGTFISDEYSSRPLYIGAVDVVPYYKFTDNQKLSGYVGFYKYFLSNVDSDLDEEQQILLNDVNLTYSYSSVVKEEVTGLTLDAGMRAFFPTSLASQHQTKIISLNPSITLRGAWDWFSAMYVLSYTKHFHEYDHAGLEDNGGLAACVNRTQVSADVCFPGGYANTSMSVANTLMLNFSILDELTFSTMFAFVNAYRYDTHPEDDELTAEDALSGKTQSDFTMATLSLGYQIGKYFSISSGVSTTQPPKTANAKGFRFPFYDASANNFTTIFLSGTASY